MTPATISIPLPHLDGKLQISIGDENGKVPGVFLSFLANDASRPDIPLVIVESDVEDPSHALTTYVYSASEHGEATASYDCYPLNRKENAT